MSKFKLLCRISVVITLMLVCSCNKEPVGYLEVRNLTDEAFTHVTWGEHIDFGTIPSGKEKGVETEFFTSNYLYIEIGNGIYRSQEEILVDANSSATFIVHNTDQLENLE